jgi:serine/threonine protein phosphatase PrpC
MDTTQLRGSAAATHVGRVRENNEDAHAVGERFWVVADGLEPSKLTPQEFDVHLVREIAKWIKLAKAARISID